MWRTGLIGGLPWWLGRGSWLWHQRQDVVGKGIWKETFIVFSFGGLPKGHIIFLKQKLHRVRTLIFIWNLLFIYYEAQGIKSRSVCMLNVGSNSELVSRPQDFGWNNRPKESSAFIWPVKGKKGCCAGVGTTLLSARSLCSVKMKAEINPPSLLFPHVVRIFPPPFHTLFFFRFL